MGTTDSNPAIAAFLDPDTETFSYVVSDPQRGAAAIVDPVLNYDAGSGRTSTQSADLISRYVQDNQLRVEWILETHAHADHLSAAQVLKQRLGGKIAIGERIREIQEIFGRTFNLSPELYRDSSQFDHLFAPDETFNIGTLEAQALAVPGHTPADMAYRVGDTIFVGDTLFMPDIGTARCDFPGGDARALYQSVRRLLAFPDSTRLCMCHDYPPGDRTHRWETTVAEQRIGNIHVRDGISEEMFIDTRNTRDAELPMPRLIIPSIQVNIRAGALPPAENNGIRYLKIPINTL